MKGWRNKERVHMLTHEQIVNAVAKAATKFPLTRVSYFGSYADGIATEESDLDVLVEFTTDAVSLLKIIALKHNLEDELNIKVDVLHAPLPETSRLKIRNTVPVYERTG
jgi:predicted nucleotidyltransferase